MNSEIRRLIRKRDSLRTTFKLNHDPEVGKQYRACRNKVVSEIRKAKARKDCDLDMLLSSQLPSKVWWKLCKESLRPWTKSLDGPLKDSDGNLVTDNYTKAELFNDSFVSQTLLDTDSASIPITPLQNSSTIDPLIIMPEEVYKILSNLDPNKATGPDGLGNFLLKEAAVPIAQPLSELFNFSLSLCKFPSIWKIAQVVPIFKKGDPLLCTNYRPISLLPCISKVYEKLLFDHIFSFLKSNNLLLPNQSGFIPGDSTVNQLMSICNKIAAHFDKGEEVIGVFLDLTKAFDKVWHEGLLFKLRNIGICGQIYELLFSYLQERRQFVTLNGEKSQIKQLYAGVPQGSVLGPLLFLIYINDITDQVQNVSYLFADDTSVFAPFSSVHIDRAVEQLNVDLREIHCWAKKWLINIHPGKTVAMLFSVKRHPSILPPIYLGDQPISFVPIHTHLGVTLTPTLNWCEHINKVSSKCYKVLGILKKFKYRWTRRTLETCYLSFIRPIIEYGSILYDSCGKSDSSKLEGVQLEAARLVTGAKRGTSHSALYRELGWHTLKERRTMHKLTKMYSIIKSGSPSYLAYIVQSFKVGHRISTRSQEHGCLNLPFCKLEIYKRSPLISGMHLWNQLEVSLKGANTLNSFKSQLEKKCFPKENTYFYHIPNRSLQVALMQMRLGFSNLNGDLAKHGCIPNPNCTCGFQSEDVNHYFLFCPLYRTARQTLLESINEKYGDLHIDTNVLLYGSPTLNKIENNQILEYVFKFIDITKRF